MICPRGLYALTPDDCPAFLERVGKAIAGGARMIQYRDKTASAAERGARAEALLALCRSRRVPLIINDDLELALALDADGAHLGARDAPIHEARSRFPHGLIGASCYNDLARARDAIQAGASYVAFGSFHESATKPEAVTARPDLLTRARQELSAPICAIGGIRAENAASMIQAGANLLAVSGGIFSRPNVAAAARSIASKFPPDD